MRSLSRLPLVRLSVEGASDLDLSGLTSLTSLTIDWRFGEWRLPPQLVSRTLSLSGLYTYGLLHILSQLSLLSALRLKQTVWS